MADMLKPDPSFADDMELGHTLIRESKTCFYVEYSDGTKCGCAIGSAAAARGMAVVNTRRLSGSYWIGWVQVTYPIAGLPLARLPFEMLIALIVKGYRYFHFEVAQETGFFDQTTVARLVSDAHAGGMPRLEIAQHIRRLEDWACREGLIPTSKEAEVNPQTTDAPAAALLKAGTRDRG